MLIVSVCTKILYIGCWQGCKRSLCNTTSGERMTLIHIMIQITLFFKCLRIFIRSTIRLLQVKYYSCPAISDIKKTVGFILFILFTACTVMLLHNVNRADQWHHTPINFFNNQLIFIIRYRVASLKLKWFWKKKMIKMKNK